MAFEDTADCHVSPSQNTPSPQRLDGVLRARRIKPTGIGKKGRQANSVQTDTADEKLPHRGNELRSRLTRQLYSSRSTAKDEATQAGLDRTTRQPSIVPHSR